MIVIGNKYKFTQIEKKRLLKKFNFLYQVDYKAYNTNILIKKIERILKVKNKSIIVLNHKDKLEPKLIEHLSKLEAKGVKYINIDDFLEKYLQKYYFLDKKINSEIASNLASYNTTQYIQKRVIDYIGILFLTIPTIISMIYSKYRIKKESPGPILYKQTRVGKNKKHFKCIKIRSMHLDAEKNGAKFASNNDLRVFKWGETIRKTKLDELTQIWNVLKGEMHLVGPRPERPIWTKEFEKSIPHYNQRHVVAPGITGLAQIKYQYGAGKLDAEQKLMYDLYYIKNWSLKLELEIIWKTAIFILTKRKHDLSNF